MTQRGTDGLAGKLVDLMLQSWPAEEGPVEEMFRRRAGRIHVAGHSVMTQMLGLTPDSSPFDWPLSCTKKNAVSIDRAVIEAQPCTIARGELERDVLICLAGIAAESIDSPADIDQKRARLERAAAIAHLHSVESDEKVVHYWSAYLFELAVRELSKVWGEVQRNERRLMPRGPAVPPQKLQARVVQPLPEVSLALAEPARIIPPAPSDRADADRRQRNAAYIDDGVLDSRLYVLRIPARFVKLLGNAGVMTVRDLISLRLNEIEQIRGIGESGARALEAVLNAERYLYMPGDYPERWRRYVPGSEEEVARAWKTDPSAPIESVGLDRRTVMVLRRANIHCLRDLLVRGESDLLATKRGVTMRQLAAIEEAMLPLGYILVGAPIHRRWQNADKPAPSQEPQHPSSTESDAFGSLETLSLPDRVIQTLHTAQLYTIADLLATSEQYFQPIGLDSKAIAQVTSAMSLKGFVLVGLPAKRRFVRVRR